MTDEALTIHYLGGSAVRLAEFLRELGPEQLEVPPGTGGVAGAGAKESGAARVAGAKESGAAQVAGADPDESCAARVASAVADDPAWRQATRAIEFCRRAAELAARR
jgi:hypothetical protein